MIVQARVALCVLLVFLVIHVVPFAVYGLASALDFVQPPEQEVVGSFVLGVTVEKLGHALAFVLVFYLARGSLRGRWLLYAAAWWLLYVLGEAGTAIRGGFSWPEAAAGVVSETFYLPISAFLTSRLLGKGPPPPGLDTASTVTESAQ